LTHDPNWIETVREEGVLLARMHLKGDWGFSIPERDAAYFHFVAAGQAVLRRVGHEAIELNPGDFVLLPQGSPHELAFSTNSVSVPLDNFVKGIRSAGDSLAPPSTMICGHFGLDRHMVHTTIRALPTAVVLRSRQTSLYFSLVDTMRLLRNEVERKDFANRIVIRDLISILFVFVLREWSSAVAPEKDDWLSGLQDARIARALSRIHELPEYAWTIDSLACEAGLSKSAFSQQFKLGVGVSPHHYLTRWRMGLAAELLQRTGLRLAEIASRVGFRTEFSFSRAFRQSHGLSPMQYRERLAVTAQTNAKLDLERSVPGRTSSWVEEVTTPG
jgi:AraC family transcriptional activator of mtrCDE